MQPTAILRSFTRPIRSLVFVATLLLCANTARADDSKSIKNLRDALVTLAPDVDPAEAELLSATAHNTARRLAREWHVVPPAQFQNFLIHIGRRQWGYCFHWAYGIGGQLKELRPKTLVLHWGASDPGTLSESNCVVVTARGQPFYDGYVIDAWRGAGRLYWWPVKKDNYAWKEDLHETAWLNDYGPEDRSRTARSRSADSVDDRGGVGGTHASTRPRAASDE
jgi:hypothetical protein